MRSFIAIEIPSEIQVELATLEDRLRRANADVAWVKPENIHLTLKFLGEIEDDLVGEIERACVEALANFHPIELRLNRTGVFPNFRHPHVLWVGLAGAIEAIKDIQRNLDQRLAALGFRPEAKVFHPHLTIGRIRSGRNAAQMLAWTETYDLPALSFEVGEIVLMKSELHPQGSRYSQLARIRL